MADMRTLEEIRADRRREGGAKFRGFLLVVALFGVIILGGWWLDQIGFIDYKAIIYPFLSRIPLLGENFLPAPEGILSEEDRIRTELEKQRDSLRAFEGELIRRDTELAQKEKDIEKREEELRAKFEELALSQKAFQEEKAKFDNMEKNLQEIAVLFTNMPPEDAMERLNKLDDLQLIDILRKMEEFEGEPGDNKGKKTVARILTLMDPERASILTRKMLKSRTSLNKEVQLPLLQGR